METEEIIDMDLENRIQNNYSILQKKVFEIAKNCNRPDDSVKIIGVSKFFPASYAQVGVKVGITDLGENRVQELNHKRDVLESKQLSPQWHMIGSLQKNKVKYLIDKNILIHSVDSEELLQTIYLLSEKNQCRTSVLLQVNMSQEESKHGFDPEKLITKIRSFQQYSSSVDICGLMTMAPKKEKDGRSMIFFRSTKNLFDEMKRDVYNSDKWNILSMGMSQDFPEAIQCGATHIRIGTAIFGARD